MNGPLRPSQLPAVLLLVVLTWQPGGCAPRPPSTRPNSATPSSQRISATSDRAANEPADAPPIWPFWPVRMRIHPLTRLTDDPQTSRAIIECRIEFQDADGQTSKAVGQLTLQAYADSSTATGSGALETWNQDLRDLEVNRRQYDDVTRTYLFRLQTSQPLPAGADLRAFFLSADGQRMSAQMRLR